MSDTSQALEDALDTEDGSAKAQSARRRWRSPPDLDLRTSGRT